MAQFDESKVINTLHLEKAEPMADIYARDCKGVTK